MFIRRTSQLQDTRVGNISLADIPVSLDSSLLKPKLIAGEVAQGILTASFVAASSQRRNVDESYAGTRLSSMM